MIIVEGPDGAGKSTLVSRLEERYGFVVGERGVQNRDELWKSTVNDTLRALSLAVRPETDVYIWDRLYYSELVYHKITDRSCAFNPVQRTWIENMIHFLRAPVILCLPPLEVVQKNAHKEHQMDGVKENIDRIYHNYLNLSFPSFRTVVYDYTLPEASPKQSPYGSVGLLKVYQAVDKYLAFRKDLRLVY